MTPYYERDWHRYIWCRAFEVEGCLWCRGPLNGRRAACCSPLCTKLFSEQHFWSMASEAAIKRAGYACERCGKVGRRGLEVHHKVPIGGRWQPRSMTCLNHQDNLLVLCHDCHRVTHSKQQEPVASSLVATTRAEAKQGVLAL